MLISKSKIWRTIRVSILLVPMLASACIVTAQKFEMTDNCIKAYKSFMCMKLDNGKKLLLKEMSENPTNSMPVILANYEDFISLSFNENPAEYNKRKSNFDKRITALEHTDKNSPYYLFGKGLLYLQWCIIKSKKGEYWNAAWDFRKSYILFSDNKKKYPNFPYHDVFLGTQQAIISTIPSGYKWVSNILGLKGNMKQGMSMLQNFFNSSEVAFKEESYLYYIYLTNYLLNDVEGALALIKNHNLDTKNNMLYLFMAANLALNNKKAGITESLILNRTISPEYGPFPMLDYELADAKMKRLDFTAIDYFEKYLQNYKGNFYLKDACLSISYCYYLMGNMPKAEQYKNRIKQVGTTDADADKQAQKFSEKGKFPDKDLLKARLLNDGGNNSQALKVLLAKDPKSFGTEAEKLEYYYRMARVYDDMAMDDKALEFYDYTLKIGSNSTEYFAARAALQAGYIYEKRKNKAMALKYFNTVLNLDDHEYKNSLDQRAKSSINRINGN